MVEVKGVQVDDEDYDSAGPDIRVGLSLKGVDASELKRSPWLDDGSFKLADNLKFEFHPSHCKQSIDARDLHLQLPGDLVTAKFSAIKGSDLAASLPYQVPVWGEMRLSVIDLNGKSLRVAGGATARL